MQRNTFLFRHLLLIGLMLCLSSLSYFFILTVKEAISRAQDSVQSHDVLESQIKCPQTFSTTSTPTDIPTPMAPPLPTDIPTPMAAPPLPTATPSLSICSPSYSGVNAGPFGARIVLIGENFPSPPSRWFLISNSQGPNVKNIISREKKLSPCIAPGCYHLSQPDQTTSLNQSQQLFSWVWKAPSFPNRPVPSEFYFVVLLKNGAIVSSNGSPNFTLLSSDPICVDIINNNVNTTRCNPDQTKPQQSVAGSTVTVVGTNWLLGQPYQASKQTVAITATCASQYRCNRHSAMLINSIPVLPNGSFFAQIHIPSDLQGTFTITATNRVADSAGSVLTFGDTPSLLHLTLTISPSSPSPSFDDVFRGEVASIVFAIPALVAIVSFVILDPRNWKRHPA